MKHLILGVVAVASIAFNRLPANTVLITPAPPVDVIQGQGWKYETDYKIVNKTLIQRLIQCESSGRNITATDSNGLPSRGILQYNGTETWDLFQKKFNFYGSPLVPADAIHMTDMAISAGYGSRWSCWGILALGK